MKTGTKKFIASWVASALSAVLAAGPAFAGNAYDNSYCDSFCDQLVNVNNGQVLGLNGEVGWTAADDEACALAEGATPSPTPVTGAAPLPMPSTQTQAFQCQWHAGQALQYCEAYVAPEATGANGFQKVLLALDVFSAGACWTACAYPTAETVCDYSAAAAGVTQFIDSLAVSDSGMSKAIEASLSGLGAAGGIVPLVQGPGMVAGQTTVTVDGIGSESSQSTTYTTLGQGQTHAQHNLACATAAVMSILSVMRYEDMKASANTQQKACSSLQQLASNAPVISNVGAMSTGIATSGGSAAPLPGAMAQANGPLGNGQQSAACAQGGLGAGGCGFTSAQLSSTDAKILNSGLGQAVAAQAAQQEPAIMSQLGSSGSGGNNPVGQALAAAAPNADIAKAISTLAAKTAEDAGKLGAAPSSTGNGGGGQQAQPQAFSFGMDNNAPSAGAAETSFAAPAPQAQAESGDIFHSDFKGSIFEIISQKMTAVQGQVAQLPWSTPLNRALAGGSSAVPAPAPQGVNP